MTAHHRLQRRLPNCLRHDPCRRDDRHGRCRRDDSGSARHALVAFVAVFAVLALTAGPALAVPTGPPLTVPAAPDAPAVPAIANRADGGEQVGYYGQRDANPLARRAFEWRHANAEYNPSVNVAVTLVDITGLEVKLDRLGRFPEVVVYEVVSRQELISELDPEVYRRLRDKGVTKLLRLITKNIPRADRDEQGVHSEELIVRTLETLGVDLDRMVELYSDRQPCAARCAKLIPDQVKVYYAVRYGLTEEDLAEVAKLPANQRAGAAQRRFADRNGISRGLLAQAISTARTEKAAAEKQVQAGLRNVFDCAGQPPRAIGSPRPPGGPLLPAGPVSAGPEAAGSASTGPVSAGLLSAGPDRRGPLFPMAAARAGRAADCGPAPEESPAPGAAGAAAAGASAGALARALASPVSAAPGGIDFSSLELRYISEAKVGDRRNVRYAFKGVPGIGIAGGPAADRRADTGLRVAQESSDAFFVWLALPTHRFTVNLNPSEPNRIVDPELGRTDAGRILLEADLRMKKTVAKLIHPDTRRGARFWNRLSGECLSFRQWIVPAPATVHETPAGELYILEAPLSVKMETEYLSGRGAGRIPANCPGGSAADQKRNEAVFREMILPEIERAVNTAPGYAALRRVYLSRVAAGWYRKRSASERMRFSGVIDSGDISRWTSRKPWRPTDVFKRYVRSFEDGEFKVTKRTTRGNVVEIRTYIYGGVDFTRIPRHAVDAPEFRGRWSGLSGTVTRALTRPALHAASASGGANGAGQGAGQQVWLGGTAVSVREPLSSLDLLLRLLAVHAGSVVLGGLAVLLVLFGRRLRAPRPRRRPA
jgi:hypothetical protein